MWNGFIGKQINRSNRNMLMSNLSLLTVPVAIAVLGVGYWQNFFAGPVTMTPKQLAAVKSAESLQHDYIAVKGDKTIDSGMTEITQTKKHGSVTSERTSANFVALAVDDQLLIVKAKPENAAATSFVGQIKPVPDDVRSNLIAPLLKKHPDAEGMFYPYMLDQAEDYKSNGYWGLAIGIPCLALSVWNLQKVGRRWGKPAQHPIAQQLGKMGDATTDATTIAANIEQEITAPNTHKIGKVTITPSWVFRPTTYGLQALQLEDLVWFYQKVTTHRTNGVPTGKTYSTVLYDRAGRTFEMNSSEKQVTEILNILYDKAPWAISGYSDDLQKMWKKERTSLIAAVDERRMAA